MPDLKKFLSQNLRMDHLPPIRLAPLGGRFSWKTLKQLQEGDLIISLQTQRDFAFISKAIYKPWRIVATTGDLVGREIGEYDSKDDAEKDLDQFADMMTKGFDEEVKEEDLEDGDVISVPTAMGKNKRHYGVVVILDGDKFVVEYQGDPKAKGFGFVLQAFSVPSGTTGEVRQTPFDDFKKRTGLTDLKRARFKDALADASERALSKVGVKQYHFLINNCETFARWAKTNVGCSAQASGWLEGILNSAFTDTGTYSPFIGVGCLIFVFWIHQKIADGRQY